MGRAIGVRLSYAGHKVAFGSRRMAQAVDAANRASSNALATGLDEAARFGDVLIWTPKETDPGKVLEDPARIAGKVIVDVNNREYDDVRDGVWFAESLTERLQGNLPENDIVKAFNTLPMEVFDVSQTDLECASASTFLAGGSNNARMVVGKLAMSLGFTPVDLGGTGAATRAAEALGDAIRMLLIDGGYDASTHLKVSALPSVSLNLIGSRQVSQYG